MSEGDATGIRKRDLLALIGMAAGGAVMYRAMSSMGFAAESTYTGPIRLEGDSKGASVLILGAGLAGHFDQRELRVRVLPPDREIFGRDGEPAVPEHVPSGLRDASGSLPCDFVDHRLPLGAEF